MFDNFFKDIINCNINDIDSLSYELCESEEEREQLYLENQIRNEFLKKRNSYKNLYNGEYINFHSDDACYENSNILNIKKTSNQYILEFIQQDDKNVFGSSIRISNSGCNYYPFNLLFMKMFNELQTYDTEYHQIHLEEYCYKKKIKI